MLPVFSNPVGEPRRAMPVSDSDIDAESVRLIPPAKTEGEVFESPLLFHLLV